jgi:putative NADH-flavin reductase
VNSYAAQIAAVKAAGNLRFLVVGGAASLKTEDGTEFVDTPMFPPQFLPNKHGIMGLREVFYNLKKETDFDWAFFSPAVIIFDGERTGKFRWGTDKYFTDDEGQSRISVQDYAVAMIDEAEKPKHHQTRFTVAY